MKDGMPEKDRVAIMKKVTAAMEKVSDETEEQRAARVMGFLSSMSSEMSHAEGLSDGQLIDEVLQDLWGDLDMNSRESALLEELIQRFKSKTGMTDGVDNVS